jgi:plasmid maintenance system killer protein
MTKKSQARIQRDIAEGKRKPAARSVNMSMNQPIKPTQKSDGSFAMSAADRILAECRAGANIPKDEKNTCWDDLIGVYQQMSGMLLRHTDISMVLNDNELMSFIEDKDTFKTNVKQFASDLRQMSDELQKLRALHADKLGGSDDPEEVLHSIHIFEQYNLWMTKHDGVLMPTVYHILEATNQAELARGRARAAAGQLNGDAPELAVDPAVLDVNQITDVTFNDENVGQVVGVPSV